MNMKNVMVTGGTGYIGSWVVYYLLEQGNMVHITVRDKSKKEKYAHLIDIESKFDGTLKIFEADLLQLGSYQEAMNGCEEVYHLASPFVINNIKDPQKQLVDPALEGTKNVLDAVNNTDTVKKVVLTSSVVAIYGDAREMIDQGLSKFTEEHWNLTSSLSHQPYSYSKLLAEKEAHKMNEAQNRWSLSVINPGFVMGPSLFESGTSASVGFMNDLISGKQKMGVPELNFGLVDVRDVAKAHVLAAQNNSLGRHILVNTTESMLGIATILAKKFKNKYALPTKTLPKFLLYLVGWTQGITFSFISKNIGYDLLFDNSKSREKLKMDYTPLEDTLYEMVVQGEEMKTKKLHK